MTRLVLRHESELSNLRREMGYMLFIDTEQYSCLETLKLAAVKWQELYAANKVTSSLGLTLMLGMVQALRTKLEDVLRDESLVQRYKNCGWISDGANAFSPMWHFFEWNPAEKKEFQSTTPPLPHTRIQEMLEEMERNLPQPGVLLKFRAAKDITQDPKRPATASGEASGDLVQGHELLRLEPVPELEVADLGRSATVALREVQQWERPLLSMPGARLRNPHNVCYTNSCVQAFFWIGALTGEARSVYGALQASICALHAKASLYLPECMSWRFIFAQWPRLSRQHDAGEFYRHLLQRSMPAAYKGHWESRLSLPFQVYDSGELLSPILLHLAGSTLASIILHWRDQYAITALVQHSGLVTLQLCRYRDDASKDGTPITLTPGARITLPVFMSDACTDTREETFLLAWVVFHLGEETTSGHYQAALSVPSKGMWEFYICDDNRVPRKARREDHNIIAANGSSGTWLCPGWTSLPTRPPSGRLPSSPPARSPWPASFGVHRKPPGPPRLLPTCESRPPSGSSGVGLAGDRR